MVSEKTASNFTIISKHSFILNRKNMQPLAENNKIETWWNDYDIEMIRCIITIRCNNDNIHVKTMINRNESVIFCKTSIKKPIVAFELGKLAQ
jgi:hypothetical protein